MARRGDADVAEQIKQCFREFDRDGNGAICRSELEDVLQRLCHKGQSLTKDDIQLCLSQADKNGDGVIGYDEFVDWLMRPGARIQPKKGGIAIFDMEEVLRPLFHTFDRNGNGVISYEEFEECFCILQNAVRMHSQAEAAAPDPAMLEKEARAVFRRADSSMDNKITFEEFSKWQLGLLEKSGLLNEDIKDLVPALARQLQRVFMLSEAETKGRLLDEDKKVLERIIGNIAAFTRDIWNEQEAAKNTLYGRHHYKNRWSEPPAGLNVERLIRQHLKIATVRLLDLSTYDLQALLVPELADEDAPVPEEGEEAPPRRWIARVSQGMVADAALDAPAPRKAYYIFSSLTWQRDVEAAELFDVALESFSPDMRFFCLLKTQANLGVRISWNNVQVAMRHAVDFGFFTAEQHQAFNKHMEREVQEALQKEGTLAGLDGDGRQHKLKDTLNTSIMLPPRSVMAALVHLGIFQSSSKLADCTDA